MCAIIDNDVVAQAFGDKKGLSTVRVARFFPRTNTRRLRAAIGICSTTARCAIWRSSSKAPDMPKWNYILSPS